MSSRRVAYVSRFPPPGGGIATWTRILFDRGLPEGWTPRLVDTRLPPRRQTFARGRVGPAELWRTARILLALLRELALHRPALVHVNLAPLDPGVHRDRLAVLLCRAFRVPVVVHHHGLVARLAEAPEGGLQRRSVARIARLAAANIALNEPSAAFLRGLGPQVRVVALPNFFDETALSPGPPDPRPRGDRPRVAFAAALTVAKGAVLAVEVARRLPEVDFDLYGDPYAETREDLDAAPPNVVRHGEVSHDALVAGLRRAHVLLFPSEHEGFPYAVLEAMALGLPVVATPVGAIPEMVEEGQGGRLCPRDAGQLAEAVRQVLADEPRRVAMGRFNEEKARRRYSFDAVSRELVALYASLARDEDGPRPPAGP